MSLERYLPHEFSEGEPYTESDNTDLLPQVSFTGGFSASIFDQQPGPSEPEQPPEDDPVEELRRASGELKSAVDALIPEEVKQRQQRAADDKKLDALSGLLKKLREQRHGEKSEVGGVKQPGSPDEITLLPENIFREPVTEIDLETFQSRRAFILRCLVSPEEAIATEEEVPYAIAIEGVEEPMNVSASELLRLMTLSMAVHFRPDALPEEMQRAFLDLKVTPRDAFTALMSLRKYMGPQDPKLLETVRRGVDNTKFAQAQKALALESAYGSRINFIHQCFLYGEEMPTSERELVTITTKEEGEIAVSNPELLRRITHVMLREHGRDSVPENIKKILDYLQITSEEVFTATEILKYYENPDNSPSSRAVFGEVNQQQVIDLIKSCKIYTYRQMLSRLFEQALSSQELERMNLLPFVDPDLDPHRSIFLTELQSVLRRTSSSSPEDSKVPQPHIAKHLPESSGRTVQDVAELPTMTMPVIDPDSAHKAFIDTLRTHRQEEQGGSNP